MTSVTTCSQIIHLKNKVLRLLPILRLEEETAGLACTESQLYTGTVQHFLIIPRILRLKVPLDKTFVLKVFHRRR